MNDTIEVEEGEARFGELGKSADLVVELQSRFEGWF